MRPFKGNFESLAVAGASPAFSEKLHVGRPNLPDRQRFLQRVEGMLDRKWLSNNGPLVQEFEAELAKHLGVKHCIVVCNATVALGIVLHALDIRGEVIVPSFTFIATAHSVRWHGATPVFAEVIPETHLLDPAAVERAITPRTTAVMPVHLWGQACYPEEMAAIANRHNLRLIFDAAHAFACETGGRRIGGFGDAEVFSFHATKFFQSFEGGAIATNNEDLARRARLTKNFGFSGYDQVDDLGTNGKMTEVCAACGLSCLESLDEFVARNRSNYDAYHEALKGIPGLRVFQHEPGSNYQYIVVETRPDQFGISRDRLVEILWAENVLARRYFYPGCHRCEPYRSEQPGLSLPITERLSESVLLLPTGTSVGTEDIELIGQIIRTAQACSPC